MNRREFFGMLATGTLPLINDEWRDRIWESIDPPSSSEQTYLRDFVVPEAALDDMYVPDESDALGVESPVEESSCEPGIRQRTVTTRVNSTDERSQPLQHEAMSKDDEDSEILRYDVASKKYVVPVETAEIEVDEEATLITKAAKPSAIDESLGTPADIHRQWYQDWWGADAEPIQEYATEWVEVHTNERDEPHRWMESFVRQPVLYLDPELLAAAGSRRPYFEEAQVIATTDWGVISLQSNMLTFDEGDETFETVRELAKELYQQACDVPAPIFDRESR